MRAPTKIIFLAIFFFSYFMPANAAPRAGFFLPDSILQVTLSYRTVDGLIILPVVINNTLHVNLILDTGCRNLILFGKRFEKQFSVEPDKRVEFSGLGDGHSISGRLALNNRVSIGAVLGERIPIVIINQRNLFQSYPEVHGVIGYEVFTRFEIALNPRRQEISFRPGASSELPADYSRIGLRIEDSRPILKGVIKFDEKNSQELDLMIDTGSTLGLLIKTEKLKSFRGQSMTLGRGLNGLLKGIRKPSHALQLESVAITLPSADIIDSPWNNYSSIGMDVLKDYLLIINYSKSYAGLKQMS
jgi:hypothetical protein